MSSRPKWLQFLVCLGLTLSLAGCQQVRSVTGFTFDLRFDDARGLTAGAPLRYRGIDIGKVSAVDLDPSSSAVRVKCWVHQQRTGLIRSGNVFWIDTGQSGSGGIAAFVSMEIPAPAAPPLAEGSAVRGAESWLEAQIQLSRERAEDELRANLRVQELRVVTRVGADGRLDRSFELEVGRLIPAEALFGTLLPQGDPWAVSSQDLADGRLIRVTGVFSRPQDAAWRNSQINLTVRESFFVESITYREELVGGALALRAPEGSPSPDTLGWLGQLLGKARELLEGKAQARDLIDTILRGASQTVQEGQEIPASLIAVQFVVDLPGKLIDSNAVEQQEQRGVWLFSGAELQQGLVLEARAQHILWGHVALVAGAAIVLLALVVAVLMLARREGDQQASHPRKLYR